VIRDRSFRALLAGELVSRLGSQFTMLALPWFGLVTTGSPTRMGLVFAVELVPIAIFGIPAGALVQKLGARTKIAGALLASLLFVHAAVRFGSRESVAQAA
jgi:MFS family permease